MNFLIDRIASPIGTVLVVSDGRSLCAVDFADYEDRMMTLLRRYRGDGTLVDADDPQGFSSRLRAYFAGRIDALDAIPVEAGGTPFQAKVWADAAPHPGRHDDQLRHAGAAHRETFGKPRRRSRQRLEPDLDRRALPSRDRRQLVADRLWRRAPAQALAARARGRDAAPPRREARGVASDTVTHYLIEMASSSRECASWISRA